MPASARQHAGRIRSKAFELAQTGGSSLPSASATHPRGRGKPQRSRGTLLLFRPEAGGPCFGCARHMPGVGSCQLRSAQGSVSSKSSFRASLGISCRTRLDDSAQALRQVVRVQTMCCVGGSICGRCTSSHCCGCNSAASDHRSLRHSVVQHRLPVRTRVDAPALSGPRVCVAYPFLVLLALGAGENR